MNTYEDKPKYVSGMIKTVFVKHLLLFLGFERLFPPTESIPRSGGGGRRRRGEKQG